MQGDDDMVKSYGETMKSRVGQELFDESLLPKLVHEFCEVLLAPVVEAGVECLLEMLRGAVLAQKFVLPAEVQAAGKVLNFTDQLLLFFHLIMR